MWKAIDSYLSLFSALAKKSVFQNNCASQDPLPIKLNASPHLSQDKFFKWGYLNLKIDFLMIVIFQKARF